MKIRGFETISDMAKKNKGEVNLPSRADKGSAGYDFFSPVNVTVMPNEMVVIWSDVKVYMLPDEVLKLYPRSSMGMVRVTFSNGTGIIDSSYYNNPKNEGNIGFMIVNEGTEPFIIEEGQAIGQGIFQKFLTADKDLVRKDSRTGGFGSSDLKMGVIMEEAGKALSRHFSELRKRGKNNVSI